MNTNHTELMDAMDKFRDKYGVKPYNMEDLEAIIRETRIKKNDEVLKRRKK